MSLTNNKNYLNQMKKFLSKITVQVDLLDLVELKKFWPTRKKLYKKKHFKKHFF